MRGWLVAGGPGGPGHPSLVAGCNHHLRNKANSAALRGVRWSVCPTELRALEELTQPQWSW